MFKNYVHVAYVRSVILCGWEARGQRYNCNALIAIDMKSHTNVRKLLATKRPLTRMFQT